MKTFGILVLMITQSWAQATPSNTLLRCYSADKDKWIKTVLIYFGGSARWKSGESYESVRSFIRVETFASRIHEKSNYEPIYHFLSVPLSFQGRFEKRKYKGEWGDSKSKKENSLELAPVVGVNKRITGKEKTWWGGERDKVIKTKYLDHYEGEIELADMGSGRYSHKEKIQCSQSSWTKLPDFFFKF